MFIFLFKPITASVVTGLMFSCAMFANVQAQTVAPTAQNSSAFADYKKQDDPGVADWRASNDKVRTLGGWRTYLKEAYEAPGVPVTTSGTSDKPRAPAALPENSSSGSSSSKPAPSSHSHHQHHGGEK
jgi:hypothetical protein